MNVHKPAAPTAPTINKGSKRLLDVADEARNVMGLFQVRFMLKQECNLCDNCGELVDRTDISPTRK